MKGCVYEATNKRINKDRCMENKGKNDLGRRQSTSGTIL